MRHLGFRVTGSLVFGGVALGFAALADTNLPGQNTISRTPFQPGVRTHTTFREWTPKVPVPNASQSAAEPEDVSSAPLTRSSIMAKWQRVSGANGYLLDVSTNESFRDYVEGYHDLDLGDVIGRVVTGLNPGTTYYYRVRPYTATGSVSYSEVMTATTVPTTGLTIHATFDSSITGNPNAAAIQAMINRAISIYESLFSDPITIQIFFRYSTTAADGTPLSAGTISQSELVVYTIPWSDYINALRADAKTSNDDLANASLPGAALSSNLKPSSANGRSVALNTPPAMFANGTVGDGGPYDGIVTLNSAVPFQFTRPTSGSNFDAQRSTEHEMDEVIGFGSHASLSNFRPQDLFSWSSAGHRNISSTGPRYFSINGGSTDIVNFSQDTSGDLGDWLSTACPQAHPYVQNAFGCAGQSSDVTATSPEGINLDVIGYDLNRVTLGNISTRAFVQTGDNVMIGGFIITGVGQKKVIIRAIGPSLVNYGITNPLQNPTLELHDHTGAVIASNDNWMDAPNEQEIINSGRAPSNNLESAILMSLNPGAYTAIVRGVNAGIGIGLVEVYDLDLTAESKLGNISTRAFVQTGNDVMIGGFIVSGPDSGKVIVRAIGPSLVNYGITNPLQNPTLELHDHTGAVIASNDNWMDAPNEQEIINSGRAPGNNLESAILMSLAPGAYTAIVRGVNAGIGIGLVEVYDLDLTAESKLGNISTRAFVQMGNDVMIGGFIVSRPSSGTLLASDIGPSLVNYGITNPLQNPTLELHDHTGAVIASNDNW